uniref:Alpha-endosulfine n=3 Tax=Canis lupus TaxID=9612 RepID=A0A8C0NBE6_CANLF
VSVEVSKAAKQLQKGQKYFDSGDYNMAKEKRKEKHHLPTTVLDKTEGTGDHIPTLQDCPQQKPSLSLASWLAH